KQWVKLEEERKRLEGQIAEARDRADNAQRIRDDYTRLNDLKDAGQLLRQAVALCSRLADAPDALGKLGDEQRRVAGEVDRLTAAAGQEKQKAEGHRRRAEEQVAAARRLREEIRQQENLVPTAEEEAKLQVELTGFPPDLAEQLAVACEVVRSATADYT